MEKNKKIKFHIIIVDKPKKSQLGPFWVSFGQKTNLKSTFFPKMSSKALCQCQFYNVTLSLYANVTL